MHNRSHRSGGIRVRIRACTLPMNVLLNLNNIHIYTYIMMFIHRTTNKSVRHKPPFAPPLVGPTILGPPFFGPPRFEPVQILTMPRFGPPRFGPPRFGPVQICNLGLFAFCGFGHQGIRGNLDGNSGPESLYFHPNFWRLVGRRLGIHRQGYQNYGFRLPHT